MNDDEITTIATPAPGSGTNRDRSTQSSKSQLKEVAALEAEVAMALTSPSLPIEKRLDLERRLADIRTKMGGENPGVEP
jgi:hypothetical protein